MTYVKIKGYPELVKDTDTGAILMVNKKPAEEYLQQRNIINSNKKNQEEISQIKEKLGEIDSLKQDINDIKCLLKELVSKGQ